MGALAWGLMSNNFAPEPDLVNYSIFNNYILMCSVMVFLGAMNIVGGVYLIKSANWARVLLIITSIFFILAIEIISLVMFEIK